MNLVPMVIEQTPSGERAMDIASVLMQHRIIRIDSPVDANLASRVCSQIMYLNSVSSDDIYMYINTPGGCVYSGLAIADAMESSRSDIVTIVSGHAASMGCFLCSSGTRGKRFATRRAYIMSHMVSSGYKGEIQNYEASFEHTKELNTMLMTEIANNIGVTYDKFYEDCRVDKWMSPEKALHYGEFGMIDGIITGRQDRNTGKFTAKMRDGSIITM